MVISNFTILCVVVLFVNNCIADRYGYYGNDNREPDKSQYCADLDPEANLDIRRVIYLLFKVAFNKITIRDSRFNFACTQLCSAFDGF